MKKKKKNGLTVFGKPKQPTLKAKGVTYLIVSISIKDPQANPLEWVYTLKNIDIKSPELNKYYEGVPFEKIKKYL